MSMKDVMKDKKGNKHKIREFHKARRELLRATYGKRVSAYAKKGKEAKKG